MAVALLLPFTTKVLIYIDVIKRGDTVYCKQCGTSTIFSWFFQHAIFLCFGWAGPMVSPEWPSDDRTWTVLLHNGTNSGLNPYQRRLPHRFLKQKHFEEFHSPESKDEILDSVVDRRITITTKSYQPFSLLNLHPVNNRQERWIPKKNWINEFFRYEEVSKCHLQVLRPSVWAYKFYLLYLDFIL